MVGDLLASDQGPKRLIVGTDAFMICAPQALREFVFRGHESSIAFGQAVNPDDCLMITGQAGGRHVQLAITGNNLQGIWQALAGTGAALVLRVALTWRRGPHLHGYHALILPVLLSDAILADQDHSPGWREMPPRQRQERS